MAKEDWREITKFIKKYHDLISDSQAIRRFNINSNEYLERIDRKSRDVIALQQLGYRCCITKLEYEKLKNLQCKCLSNPRE